MKFFKTGALILAVILLFTGCGLKGDAPASEPTIEDYTVISSEYGEARLKWVEPLDEFIYCGERFYVTHTEEELIKTAALIIKGSVIDKNEYAISVYGDLGVDYDRHKGTVYDIQINDVLYSEENLEKGDIVKVRSTFSSRRWDNNCISFLDNEDYIFILVKSPIIEDYIALHELAEYGMSLPWESVIIINDDSYIFNRLFKSMITDDSILDARPDIYEQHYNRNKEKYESLSNELSENELTKEQYDDEIFNLEYSLFKTYTRSDDKFIDDLKSLISLYK